MKKKITLLFTCLVIIFSGTSCIKSLICVRGNGDLKVESRRSQKFTAIENTTSFDVIYKIADTFGIEVEAEENLIDYIKTDTHGESIEITTSPGTICLNYTIKPVIRISSPSLSEIYNSGSGDIIAGNLSGNIVIVKNTGSGDVSTDRVDAGDIDFSDTGSGNIKCNSAICQNSDIKITGSGDITISGECESAHLKTSGSGNIYGNNFSTVTTSAILTGSGNIYIMTEEYLNGLLTGSGNLYFKGNPEIDQTKTGSGRIIKQK